MVAHWLFNLLSQKEAIHSIASRNNGILTFNRDLVAVLHFSEKFLLILFSDSAIMNEHNEIVYALLEKGALTLSRIQNIAATRIQAWYRGFAIRRTFNDHRDLLVRSE